MSFSARPLDQAPNVLIANNWISDTYVSVLVDAAHTHADSDTQYSDISANVVSGTEIEINSKTLVTSGAFTYLKCNNLTYTSSHSAKFNYIVRKSGGTLVTSDYLLSKIDLNEGQTGNITVNGTLLINSNGLMYVQVTSS